MGQRTVRVIYYAFLALQCWAFIQGGYDVGVMRTKPRECWAFQDWNHLKLLSTEASILALVYVSADILIKNKYYLPIAALVMTTSAFFISRHMMGQFCPGIY